MSLLGETERDKSEMSEYSKNRFNHHKKSCDKRSKMIIYGNFDELLTKENHSSIDSNLSTSANVYQQTESSILAEKLRTFNQANINIKRKNFRSLQPHTQTHTHSTTKQQLRQTEYITMSERIIDRNLSKGHSKTRYGSQKQSPKIFINDCKETDYQSKAEAFQRRKQSTSIPHIIGVS